MTSSKQYSGTPATVEALIEAIKQLASPGETKAREAVSREISNDPWQFDSKTEADTLNDFAADGELVEASPLPLSDEQYLALIQASFPASKKQESKADREASSEVGAETFNPLRQKLSADVTDDWKAIMQRDLK